MRVQLIADFTCPYCFWQLKLINHERIKQRFLFSIQPYEYTFYSLPKVYAANSPLTSSVIHQIAPALYELDCNIKIKPYSTAPNTSLACIGFYVARSMNLDIEYFDAVITEYFCKCIDISDENVLAEIAESVGIDKDLFLTELNNNKYINIHKEIMEDMGLIPHLPLKVINNFTYPDVGLILSKI